MVRDCVWCSYAKKCPDEGCDFRTIPFNKEGIFSRLEKEVHWVNDAKIVISSKRDYDSKTEELIKGLLDRTAAILVMANVLKGEFGVSDLEMKAFMPQVKLTLLQKSRLARYLYEFTGGLENGIV